MTDKLNNENAIRNDVTDLVDKNFKDLVLSNTTKDEELGRKGAITGAMFNDENPITGSMFNEPRDITESAKDYGISFNNFELILIELGIRNLDDRNKILNYASLLNEQYGLEQRVDVLEKVGTFHEGEGEDSSTVGYHVSDELTALKQQLTPESEE